MNQKTRDSIDAMDKEVTSCFTKEESEEFLLLAGKLKKAFVKGAVAIRRSDTLLRQHPAARIAIQLS